MRGKLGLIADYVHAAWATVVIRYRGRPRLRRVAGLAAAAAVVVAVPVALVAVVGGSDRDRPSSDGAAQADPATARESTPGPTTVGGGHDPVVPSDAAGLGDELADSGDLAEVAGSGDLADSGDLGPGERQASGEGDQAGAPSSGDPADRPTSTPGARATPGTETSPLTTEPPPPPSSSTTQPPPDTTPPITEQPTGLVGGLLELLDGLL